MLQPTFKLEYNKKDITKDIKDKFNGIYELIANDGRRDVVLEFAEKPNINIGKIAIWRVQLSGLVSWISDYVVNNQNDFE